MNTIVMILASLLPVVTPQQDELAAWAALGATVQSHTYPPRGRMVREPAPDYTVQLQGLDKALAIAKGTTAEPIALYYRAHTLFELGRFAEAKRVFGDLRTRFPRHGLCTLVDVGTPNAVTAVAAGIRDCEDEITVRKSYQVQTLPAATLDTTQKAIFHTTKGDFEVQFYTSAAPKTVANFKKNVESGFYRDVYFHKVMPFRFIEGGCPNTKAPNRQRTDDGFGSVGYTLPLELSTALHTAGSISMRQSPGSSEAHGSQFSICVTDQPQLNNRQAVFGQVTEGMDVVKKISQERADDTNNPYDRIWIRGVEWVAID